MLRVTWWHMQIQGPDDYVRRRRRYDHRLGIDNRGRGPVTELDLAIDARAYFTADRKVDNGCTGMRRQTAEHETG
jgi:hypothetical protein